MFDDDDDDDDGGVVDYRTASAEEIQLVGGEPIYWVVEDGGDFCHVSAEEFRIIGQFEAARRRQADALALAERRWKKPPPPEPAPEAIPPGGRLTARQALFCEHYAAQPVATRAAVLAGYAEENAATQGSRLLKNPLVLARIAALRAERKLSYVLDADTLQDKLEAVFFDALSGGNHSAAVSALRLQAGLGRLPTQPVRADESPSETVGRRKAEKSQEKPMKADLEAPKSQEMPRKADESQA